MCLYCKQPWVPLMCGRNTGYKFFNLEHIQQLQKVTYFYTVKLLGIIRNLLFKDKYKDSFLDTIHLKIVQNFFRIYLIYPEYIYGYFLVSH